MEHLYTEITDRDDTIYGVEPPSANVLTNKTDEIIDKIDLLGHEVKCLTIPRWEGGYLSCKFGRIWKG